MNVVTAAMFGVLAFGLLRRPLAGWKARSRAQRAVGEPADRDAAASVPAWVAVAAGALILSLAVLLADAYFAPVG